MRPLINLSRLGGDWAVVMRSGRTEFRDSCYAKVVGVFDYLEQRLAAQKEAECPTAAWEAGPMTPKQYIDAIDRLGLSQRAAGKFIGVDERQSRRWVAGDSAVPESVAKLLRLMIRLNLKPEDV